MLYLIICHFIVAFSNEVVLGLRDFFWWSVANSLRKHDIMQLYKHRTHLNYQIANLSVIWVHPDVITPEPCFPVLLKSPMHCGEKMASC